MSSSHAQPRPRISGPRRGYARAFTLPELLVACSIGTVLLLATYSVLMRSIRTKNEITERREQAAAARAVADELAGAIEGALPLGDEPPLAVAEEPGAMVLLCTLAEERGRGFERRRYR